MQLLVFILVFPFLWIISILPFRILYILSDIVCFIVYNIFGYRKKTVRENLELALPHLDAQKRLEIEKKFYSHLCDTFVEMIKTMTISDKEINRRFVLSNLEMIKEYEDKGKSVIILCSHYSSWEWLVNIAKKMNFRSIGVYKQLKNKYFDRLVRYIRSRLRAELVTTKDTIELMRNNESQGIKAFYGFASDQSPQISRARYWDYFMGHDVPVYTGGEMLAKKLDMNIIFIRTIKVKRGFYEATIVPLVENPRDYPDYEITSLFLREVEKLILEAPEFYFWTHKRWKHRGKRPQEL